jgi:DNA adenine methylase
MRAILIESSVETQKARPFLKWAGGKTQLLGEIDDRLPNKEIESGKIDTYIEPFVGGGAAFFHIAQKYPQIKHFCLFDINEDLVNCYKAIKDDVQNLIAELKRIEDNYLDLVPSAQKEFFYSVRKRFNSDRNPADLIFINKTCYNGLYRVNKKGGFNVPFGDYKNPTICDEENLLAVSSLLQNTNIYHGDFEQSERLIDKNTFVYFDPPYRPLSTTASFTSYAKEDFDEKSQIRLAKFCCLIHEKKHAKFLLSNSDPQNEDPNDKFFEKHYPKNHGFTIDTVYASRVINCKSLRRGRIRELIITNY